MTRDMQGNECFSKWINTKQYWHPAGAVIRSNRHYHDVSSLGIICSYTHFRLAIEHTIHTHTHTQRCSDNMVRVNKTHADISRHLYVRESMYVLCALNVCNFKWKQSVWQVLDWFWNIVRMCEFERSHTKAYVLTKTDLFSWFDILNILPAATFTTMKSILLNDAMVRWTLHIDWNWLWVKVSGTAIEKEG